MSYGCTFLEKDGYCLKCYGDGLTYYSARTVCRRDGGELLRIDNPNKQTTVERILSKTLYIFLIGGVCYWNHKYTICLRCSYFYWRAINKNPQFLLAICVFMQSNIKIVRMCMIDWLANNLWRICTKGYMEAILRVWIPRVYT